MSQITVAGYAYCITNMVNGKKYVGITSSISRRWKDHLHKSKERCHRPLYAAFDKYGRENFSFEILLCAKSWSDLLDSERLLIEQHKSYINDGGHGYNLTKGGEGVLGMRHSGATLSKMSASATGKRPTAATLAKLRGRKCSPEHIAKLRGRKISAEHRLKISAALKGRPLAAETRAKLVGQKRSPEQADAIRRRVTGCRHSEATLAKMRVTRRAIRESHPRNRAVITPDGRFTSAAIAAEHYQIKPSAARARASKGLVGWNYERPISESESRIGKASSLTKKRRGIDRLSLSQNRAVVTPCGSFPSATIAGEYYGLTPRAAVARAANRYCGWHYIGGGRKGSVL